MAVQAADLRLNNWILDHKGTPRQVAYVGETVGLWLSREDGTTQKYQDKPIYSCNIETLSPIPLDADILEKCGFVPLPNFTVMGVMTKDIGRHRVLSIGNVGTPNEMLFIKEVDGKIVNDVVCLWNFDYDGRLYLHQLQNIVNALCGEELTINL